MSAQWDDSALDDASWQPEPEPDAWPELHEWNDEARAAYLNDAELPTETERLRAYLARLQPGIKREWAWWNAWAACTGQTMPEAPSGREWNSKQSPAQVAAKVSDYGRDIRPVSVWSAGADVARERSGDRKYRARGRAW